MPRSEFLPLDSLTIDRDSPVPIYHQLVEKLTRLILSGALAPGQRLPSETELASALAISPMTARQALSMMEKHGLIRRQRGVGSFVLARMFDRPLDQLVGFTQDMAERGIEATSRILRFERVPAPQAAIELVAVQEAYFADVDFPRTDLESVGSVYTVLDHLGIHPTRAEEWIDAVSAQAEESHLLDIPVHAPMLRLRLLTWDADDRFVEYSQAVFRADLYQFHAKVGAW